MSSLVLQVLSYPFLDHYHGGRAVIAVFAMRTQPWLTLPPIGPVSACIGIAFRPKRANVRR